VKRLTPESPFKLSFGTKVILFISEVISDVELENRGVIENCIGVVSLLIRVPNILVGEASPLSLTP
jgi:hypothetical protein